MDLDAVSPDGVVVGDYLEHFITRLRARPGGAERAAMLRGLVEEAKLNLNLPLSGWDRLAWLPLSVQLELPARRLLGLFRRHWQPALKRPPAERFLETLRELIDWVGEHNAGAGLLLQIPEQRQPDASLRVLLLRWLPSLPGLCLAFTQGDDSPRPAYADLEPLALRLEPLPADDLPRRLAAGLGAGLGAVDLPDWLYRSVGAYARGAPGLAALKLADLAARDLIGPDAEGCWRLREPDAEAIDALLGPELFAALDTRLERLRNGDDPTTAAALRPFLDLACLCAGPAPFEPIAACIDPPADADALLDLIDATLVEPDDGAPTLIYHGGRHPDFPANEVFEFANPLLALHLRRRQSRRQRCARAEALFAQVSQTLSPNNRGGLALHRALLAELGDLSRAEALSGELFYWLDAAHAETARHQLIADLAARRITPEALWLAYEQHGERWPIWRRISWLEAYGGQPNGVAVGMRRLWLNRLSMALYDAGELERALDAADEALALVRAAEGAGSPNVAAALGVTGVILHDLGRHDEALARHEEALLIERKALPAGHPAIASSLNNIASVLHALGRHDEALARHEEALPIQRKALPAGHPDIASSLNNIATVLHALGRHDEALARHEEALLIQRKALPAGHPDIAISLNNIASVLHALGRHDEALARHEEALLIRRKALPAGHPAIALSLNNIASVLHALGRHDEALARHEEALLIRRKALPAGHPHIATSLDNIGWVLTATHRPAEARAAFDEAFAIWSTREADQPARLVDRCLDYAKHATEHDDPTGAAHWLARAETWLGRAVAAGDPRHAELRRAMDAARRLLDPDANPTPRPDPDDDG